MVRLEIETTAEQKDNPGQPVTSRHCKVKSIYDGTSPYHESYSQLVIADSEKTRDLHTLTMKQMKTLAKKASEGIHEKPWLRRAIDIRLHPSTIEEGRGRKRSHIQREPIGVEHNTV